MSRILAIDPGSIESAWLILADGRPERFAREPNERLRDRLRWYLDEPATLPEFRTQSDEGLVADVVVIETIQPRGERLYSQVVEMLQWAGRFAEAAYPTPVHFLSREAIKRYLCPPNPEVKRRGAAKDGDVWASLVERFGGGPDVAVGVKASPGPLYGIHSDVRAALAVGVAYEEGVR